LARRRATLSRSTHTHVFVCFIFCTPHPTQSARAMETIHPYGHKKRKKEEKEEVEGGAREASHKGTLHLHLAGCFMKGHERLASSNPNEDNERLRAGSPTVLGFQCLGGRAWDLHLWLSFSILPIQLATPGLLLLAQAQEQPGQSFFLIFPAAFCMACQQPTTTTAATAAPPPIKITGGGAPPARPLSWANIALIGGVASCSAEALTYPLGTRAFLPALLTPPLIHA
jgi:hypothetical protein